MISPKKASQNQFEPDLFRAYQYILSPDSRNTMGHNSIDDALREHYSLISDAILSDKVHNDIRVQYETARNAFLYSFFAYRLSMLALHQAVASLELGLKRFVGDPEGKRTVNTLNPLLKRANERGFIDLLKLKPHLEAERFINIICDFRNDLSHGSHTLFQPYLVADLITDCGAILSQLFDYVDANNLKPSWNAWS